MHTITSGRKLSLRVKTLFLVTHLTTPHSVSQQVHPKGRAPAVASLIEWSVARKCNVIERFNPQCRRMFSSLCDSLWVYCFKNNPFLFTKVFFHSVAVCQSISVGSCRGEYWWFLENLHFLAMKRNCIVYETTKSTQSKPYNSILCHFFFFFGSVLLFF